MRLRRVVGLVGAGLLPAVLVAGLLAPPAGAAPDKPWFPARGAYLGAEVQERADRTAPVCRAPDPRVARTRWEACLGASPYLDRRFQDWDRGPDGAVWPSAYDRWSRDSGHRLLMSWRPRTTAGEIRRWDDLAAGRWDAEIDAKARALKGFGARVYLGFHAEPEFAGDRSEFGTRADFRAAFRHIVDRFRALGVDNVKFVAILMAYTFQAESGRDPWDYYPGSSHVDAVALDGYNWYDCRPTDPDAWESAGSTFEPGYEWITARGKPVLLGELGSAEDRADPTRKARWFAQASRWVKRHPGVKAIAYFDHIDRRPAEPRDCDWRVDTTPESLAAFAAVAQDPYFQP